MPLSTTHDLASLRSTLDRAIDHAAGQMDAFMAKYPADYYPMYTVNGQFGQDQQRWTNWCDGFLPGILFMLADVTGESRWLDSAVERATPLEDRQYDRSVHDLGFLFFSTYRRWLDLDGPEDRIVPVLVQAGKTMGMRFMEKGQYLRSFMEPASLFIDIMMNVGTVFYAGLETEDDHLMAIANRHCRTSRRTLLRGDGSTAHEAIFDLETGQALRQSTQQGFRADSCWSRGLAWSLYGFTRSYEQSGELDYLAAAMLNADYYLENTPPDGIAPWDYDAPAEGPLSASQQDTSTAAIAAAGLLDLSELMPDQIRARAYADFALTSLTSLTDRFLQRRPGFEGILDGGVYHIHKGLGVDEAVLFGDYFFVEAVQKGLAFLDEAQARDSSLKEPVRPYPEDSLPGQFREWKDGPIE
jgi:unsaturated chondroitin disaccharide hydrolase